MKRTLTQKLGLLGVVSFLSYTAAVVFSPLFYPGYNWMAQAVSDLSAANAPSLAMWNRLSALYNSCELVCVMAVCIAAYRAERPVCCAAGYTRSQRWNGYPQSATTCSRSATAATPERFSVFAATGFNAALGLHLYLDI